MPQAQRAVEESHTAEDTAAKLFVMPNQEPPHEPIVRVRLVSKGTSVNLKFTISRA